MKILLILLRNNIISIFLILFLFNSIYFINGLEQNELSSSTASSMNDLNNNNEVNSLEEIIDINPSIKSLSSIDLSNKIINLYSNFPRFTFDGKRINNTFLPNSTYYAQSIILTGFPFELIIIITLLSCFIGLFVKLFIAIHRWRKKRNQFIYSNLISNTNSFRNKYLNKKPSSFKYICSTVIIIVLLLSICSFLFVSIFVNKDLDNSIILSINNLESHLNNRVDVEDRIVKECEPITRLPYSAIEIVSTTKEILNITQIGKQYINQYEAIRYEIIFVLILSLFALIALGLLSVIIRLKWASILFVGIGLFILNCVWLIPSSHVPLGVLISDICPNMDTIISNYAPESISPFVYFFLNCTDAQDFDFIYGMLDDKIVTTQISLDRAISRHYSSNTIDKLQIKLDDLKNLSRDARDILNCKITQNTYKSTQELLCVDVINSTFVLSILFSIIGFLFLITFLASIFLYSNSNGCCIRKDSENGYYKNEDGSNNNSPKKSIYKKMMKSKSININGDGSLSPLLSSSYSLLSENEDDQTEISSISSPFSSPSNRF